MLGLHMLVKVFQSHLSKILQVTPLRNRRLKYASPVGRLRAEKRTGSFTALMSALTSVVSGGTDAMADAAASNLPSHHLDPAVDVEHLDVCHLGHHK